MGRDLLFILPTYNHFDYAQRCLESFVRYTPVGTYHVAIIDDGSTDWYKQDFISWSICPKLIVRFAKSDGLTRSWNEGLRIAKAYEFKHAICGNSDLLFTEGWYEPLKDALTVKDLVGPITNAPGHAEWQSIHHFCPAKLTDDHLYLNSVAKCVRGFPFAAVDCPYVNGFCMAARTDVWWENAFDAERVFDPHFKLAGNEDELQTRWRARQKKIAFVPKSFVFHYRSVSREPMLKFPAARGAYRHESASRNDCVPTKEHSRLVDEVVG